MQKQKNIQYKKKTRVLSPRIMRELAKSEEMKVCGSHEKALEIAEHILMEEPSCVEAAEEVADNLLSLDRPREAEKAAAHALRLDPKSYIGHFVIGFVASEQEKWDEAVGHFLISNEGQSNNPEILRCLGWTLFHSGAQEEGISALERALEIRKSDPAILSDLAACYLQIHDFKKSISLLEKAIALDSHDPRVQELLQVSHRLQAAFSREIT